MTHKVAPWSFSKIKAFEQCPKQFYHEKILKEHPFVETNATRYGTEFHEAAEIFVRDGTSLDKRFIFALPMLESLLAKRGEKIPEQKMGLTENLQPCGFFSKDVWFRGIADLIILDDDLAWVIDYKTGKNARYADKGQLELMALTLFAHYPKVKKIRAGLLFVVSKELIKDKYTEFDKAELWKKWLGKYERMCSAAETNTWNAKPSGLCKRYCPVTVCVHNGNH
jgi:ATP-dependent exoDNAse (exonuclease V) beta subunit